MKEEKDSGSDFLNLPFDESSAEEHLFQSINIIIAHENESTLTKMAEAVRSLGHEIKATCRSTPELIEACKPATPDLIMSGTDMPGGDSIEALIEISNVDPTPAIVITPQESLKNVEQALRDHVMAYLVEPIDVDQIKPTIYLVCERFKQFEMLKSENDDLKQTLAERKIIERAKGIIMGQMKLSEEDAFKKLQKLAQSKRMKIAMLSAALIDSAEKSND